GVARTGARRVERVRVRPALGERPAVGHDVRRAGAREHVKVLRVRPEVRQADRAGCECALRSGRQPDADQRDRDGASQEAPTHPHPHPCYADAYLGRVAEGARRDAATVRGRMSLWLDESPPEPRPALDHDASADAVVIGAGVAGVATAYWLARAGARPLVLEARTIAEAASGRNAGFLLAGVAENFLVASRRYGEPKALRIWRFTRRNQELVRELVARHRIDCDLRWHGSAQIAG